MANHNATFRDRCDGVRIFKLLVQKVPQCRPCTMSPAPREKDVQLSVVPVASKTYDRPRLQETNCQDTGRSHLNFFNFESSIVTWKMPSQSCTTSLIIIKNNHHITLHVHMPWYAIPIHFLRQMLDISPVQQLRPLMINSTQDDLARAAQVSSHLCRSKGGQPWHQKGKLLPTSPNWEISKSREWHIKNISN